MAWSTPITRSTGDLITAAIWNQDAVNNPIALSARGATLPVGNQYQVLQSGEIMIAEVPADIQISAIYVWEFEGLSGSATLTLYKATSLGGSWSSLQDCSLSSQAYRSITGLSHSLNAGDWLKLEVSGTPSTVKRVAVALRASQA